VLDGRCDCGAVARRLNENPRGILLAKGELSHWFASFDQYRDKSGSDVSRWLQLYDGDLFAVDRVTGGRSYRIPNPRVSIASGVQPDTLRRLLTDEYFERGLPARILWAMPPRSHPRKYTKQIVSPELFAEVSQLFSKLRELTPKQDEHGHLMPTLLPLSPKAEEVWVEFYDEIGQIIYEADPRTAGQWSKLIGYAARLALIGELAHDPDAREISAEIMRKACELAHWFGNEAVRIYATLVETTEQREARELIRFVESRGGGVTIRESTQYYWPFRNDREKAEQKFNALVKRGFGKSEPVPTTAKGGKPTRKFQLLSRIYSTKPPDLRGKVGGSVDVEATSIEKITPSSEPQSEAVIGDEKGVGKI
jgi:uncharacterized protein DUF3987